MATPSWVRKRRTDQARMAKLIRMDQYLEALTRNVDRDSDDDTVAEWTPRRGMAFASE